MSRRTRWLFVAVGLSTVAAGACFLWMGASLSAPVPRTIGSPPETLAARSVEIPSGSGSMLSAWIAVPQYPRAGIVLLHCVRCDRRAMVERAELLYHAGYAVLLPDLQAHGQSPGRHITFGFLESRDAIASVEYLRRLVPNLKVGGLGVSLGGAAFLLATPPAEVDALVLESVYPTLEEAVSNRIAMRLGPLSKVLSPLLLLQLGPRLDLSTQDLRPIDQIAAFDCPVLVLAGSDDRHTTKSETLRLFEAASEPKQLWLVPNAGHVDLLRFDPSAYTSKVFTFLDQSLLRPEADSHPRKGK